MDGCICCPRRCGVDRNMQAGFCGAGVLPRVARAALHFWEEPMFSGTRGSGTVFFSGCSLRCIFCQNADISARQKGEECNADRLADLFLMLQEQGAHNINLVTPTPHILTIRPAIQKARERGLRIPTLYNSGGYETVEALQTLDGLIDIYLPDLKYVSPVVSKKFSSAENYFAFAAPALSEMYRQAGDLRLDENGIAISGLVIRHLVLPGCLDETRKVLDYINEVHSKNTWISLMRQYTPMTEGLPSPLNRCLTAREYERAVSYCLQLGFTNVLLQEEDAADSSFTPAFYESLSSSS